MPNGQESGARGLNTEESLLHAPEEAGMFGVLKCYFYTPKRGDIWGAFCFLFDGTTGEAIENVFWVTRALVGPAIDVNVQWRSFNKLIPQMGTYEKQLGDKLSVLIHENIPAGKRIELCRSDNPPERLIGICSEIRSCFERATHCFLEVKIAFERMTARDMESAGLLTKEDSSAETKTDKMQSNEKSFAGTLINCLPIIDPVRGKPVSELEPDDIVEVKLQGGVGAGEMIHKYLASTNQDAMFPIERIEKTDSEKTYIYLNINEELKGLITVTKDLRLRVLDIGKKKKTTPGVPFNPDNAIFFGVLAVAAVVIAMVVRFLLY